MELLFEEITHYWIIWINNIYFWELLNSLNNLIKTSGYAETGHLTAVISSTLLSL